MGSERKPNRLIKSISYKQEQSYEPRGRGFESCQPHQDSKGFTSYNGVNPFSFAQTFCATFSICFPPSHSPLATAWFYLPCFAPCLPHQLTSLLLPWLNAVASLPSRDQVVKRDLLHPESHGVKYIAQMLNQKTSAFLAS